jgi:hypothetical protein
MDCTNFKVGIVKNNEFPIFCDTGIPVLAINKLFIVGFAILAHHFSSLKAVCPLSIASRNSFFSVRVYFFAIGFTL